MSLKAVHILFILLSLVLTLGLGFWGLRHQPVLGVASFSGGGVLVIYLLWFFSKMRKIG